MITGNQIKKLKKKLVFAVVLCVGISMILSEEIAVAAGDFVPDADGKLPKKTLDKEYRVNEIGLLPGGYAWKEYDKDGESIYKIVSEDEFLGRQKELFGNLESGDIGEEGTERLGAYDDIPDFHKNSSRKELQLLLCSAAGKLLYSNNGRIFDLGFMEMPAGVNNAVVSSYGETGYGVDSTGLLYWAFRNVFGYTPADFSDVMHLYEVSEKVGTSELIPGDIGMLTDMDGEMNHYGICVGYHGTAPVFAHMNSIPDSRYPSGVLELSELKGRESRYYRGYAPVEFHYFFRLNLPWED